MTPFTDSPAHRLRAAYIRMHRATNRVLRPFGVTADQYVVLRILSECDGVIQQELCDASVSDPTSMGRMLDLMEEKRLVRRSVSSDDRRRRLVHLTAHGRKVALELYEACREIRDALHSVFSDPDANELHTGLGQVAASMHELESAGKVSLAESS